MSENISLEEIKKIWPSSAPDISNINKYVEKYKSETIVIKYGGNVLIDRSIFNNFIEDIGILNKLGLSIVVVHGGGPRIKRELEKSNITTKFIKGLRVTDKNIIDIVEKAPKVDTFKKKPLCLPYDSSRSRVWIRLERPKVSSKISK